MDVKEKRKAGPPAPVPDLDLAEYVATGQRCLELRRQLVRAFREQERRGEHVVTPLVTGGGRGGHLRFRLQEGTQEEG